MATEVLLSQFGMGMQDGKILQWYVAEGASVVQGQPICQVEAAKSLVDIEAPVSGIVSCIVVLADETAQVRDIIALIDSPDDGEPSSPAITTGSGGSKSDLVAEPVVSQAVLRASEVPMEPRARRLAANLKIDLTLVMGSGPMGRILTEDVERFAASRAPASVPQSTYEFEDVPVSSMRRTIAQRLSEAKRAIPHFYLKVECRADRLLELRRRLNAGGHRSKISVNDMAVKAAALSLHNVPEINVSWRETVIRHHRRVDVTIAVATKQGLFTPIICNADVKPLVDLAEESAALVKSARNGTLQLAQYEGGSLTVSNLGMYGVEDFIAIINPPQAAILALGVAKRKPVIVDNEIVAGTVFTATLSVDHRAIDGAAAGRFLQSFQALIETAELDA